MDLCLRRKTLTAGGTFGLMAKTKSDFESVCKIGLALPGVEKGTAYGSPALKVRGQMMTCIPINRSAEPGSLAVRVDIADRAELLAAQPDIYYVTDHYMAHDTVLVRLSRIGPDVLRDLLGMAHKYVTSKSRSRSAAAKRRKR